MNSYEVVLKPARAALILFALSIVIAFIVVAGLGHYRAQKQQFILKTEQRLTATTNDIARLTFDLDSINSLAKEYKRLEDAGFIGEPDRDGWVQRMEAIYRDTHLPPTLRYTLAPPQLLNAQPVPADADRAYLNNVLHHDLNLELSGINDRELLDFIDKFDSNWQAPYRIETCQISRETEVLVGLQIKCTVQLYSLPENK